MEAHHTGIQWNCLEVKGQRLRSPGRLMLGPEVRHIFRPGRPTNFKLGVQTQHEDPHQRQAPWPSRSMVKVARSRDASDRCWPISRERNGLDRPKLVGRLSTPRTIMRPRFKVKGQRLRSPGRLMLRPEVRHIFLPGRPTNFKLGIQTQHENPHQRQAPWSSRSKVKIARSRDASDRCWSISRERNVLGIPKLVGRLSTQRAIMRSRFKVKGQGHQAD